ncbi:MAG: hypothetical protein ABI639_09040 [Thermoanaerobaculia bacterium]
MGTMLAWLALGVAAARAQLSPLGGQFEVNSYTTNQQYQPAVSSDSDGNFVIVWTSFGSSGTDSSNLSVQARRWAADGAPLGGHFQVNTYTTSTQRFPAVSVAGDGAFVAAWPSIGSNGTDTSDDSIQLQRFGSNGSAVGAQAQANSYTTSDQQFPSVSIGSTGSFVVAWESTGSAGSDSDGSSVQLQRFASNGAGLGQIQVNTFTTGAQLNPQVAVLGGGGGGDFVVVWNSDGSAGTDTSSTSVQGRRYAANGTALSGEFQVNTYTTSGQRYPAIAADGAGNFIVVWHSFGSTGTDTSSFSIQAQRFAANGAALGAQFQVNTYTPSVQQYPTVAVNSGGDFVVAWQSLGSNGTDSDSTSIRARRFAANGSPLGGDAQVNTYTTGDQGLPVVAAMGAHDFVIAWQSPGSFENDDSQSSIQAQRFGCVFCDGFENGTTNDW